MEVGQTIYYLQLGKKFPNIYSGTIVEINHNDPYSNVIVQYNGDSNKGAYQFEGFEREIKGGYIHYTMLSALEKRKEWLNKILTEETEKFNTFVSKVNKWKEKKK